MQRAVKSLPLGLALVMLLLLPALGEAVGRDPFAQRMIAAMLAAGETRPIHFDRDRFLLRIGTGNNETDLSLYNAFDEYNTADESAREAVLERYARNMTQRSHESPARWDDAWPHLLPLVRARSYAFFFDQFDHPLHGTWKPLGSNLATDLGMDSGEMTLFLEQSDLVKWSKSYSETWPIALRNLGKLARGGFEKVSPGLYRSAVGDNYDVSRILLLDRVQALPLKGMPVAMVPNRRLLLLAGSDDSAALSRMLDLAESGIHDDREVDARPLILRNHQWQTWTVGSGQPLGARFTRLRLYSEAVDYNAQCEAIVGREKKPFNHMQLVEVSTSDHLECEVMRGRFPALVPQVDTVTFDEQVLVLHHRLARSSWQRFQTVMSRELHPAPGLWPVRWQLDRFPNAKELQKLGNLPG